MSDDQVWILINAPHVSNAGLARAFGVPESTIRNRRWRLQRTPWSCGLRHVPCAYCGELALLPTRQAGMQCHVHCRTLHIRQSDAARAATRAFDQDDIDRVVGWMARLQHQSLQTAIHHGSRWTDVEDAYLLAHWDAPLVELTTILGRTAASVATRRHLLKARGIKEGTDPPP